MNDPSATDICDENLMEDLKNEFMEKARHGDYDTLYFAEEESSYYRSTVRGLVMGIIKAHLPGRQTILGALSGAALAWATREYPTRVAASQEMKAEWENPETA